MIRLLPLVFFPLFVAVVGWFAYRAADSRMVPIVCSCVAALSILLGALRPAAVKPVWLATMYITFPIGFVLSHVLMGAAYYFVLGLAGLIMKIIGYDPLKRTIEPARTSYWIRRPDSPESARYFRQF